MDTNSIYQHFPYSYMYPLKKTDTDMVRLVYPNCIRTVYIPSRDSTSRSKLTLKQNQRTKIMTLNKQQKDKI